MTDVCRECRFRDLCEFIEYPLDCENQEECEHYENFLDGYYQAMDYDGE